MSLIDKVTEGMDVQNWPHRFTKVDKVVQIGEVKDESGRGYDPIFAQPMVCLDCHVKWLNGKEARPPDPCPARNKKRELGRLFK